MISIWVESSFCAWSSFGSLIIYLLCLWLTDPQQCKLITAAAATDGATILTKGGRVLDIACMVQTPTPDILIANGFDAPKTFPGARSTAAWNASMFGTVLKVSADGPISIWRHGIEIAQVG